MNKNIITTEEINALLVAPVFPDSEYLFFPHNIFPPTDESIEKVKEIVANSRTRKNANQVDFLFKGSYLVRSVPLEYRNDSEMIEGYKNISPNDNFNYEIAIESFVEFLIEENDYQHTSVRFPQLSEITYEPPFPSHPLIKKVCVNDQEITAQTHLIDVAVLDKLVLTAQYCLDNCEYGGGFVPYGDTAEYSEFFFLEPDNY